MTLKPTLRDRLIARYRSEHESPEPIDIPVKGRIDAMTVARVHNLALRATSGDIQARDCLWISLRPRIDSMSWVLRPWPNSPRVTGIWDRDDVRQESWIVFAELLAAWDRQVSFIPYLLARFAWRLRDRILRGIGKQQSQYGTIRVPEVMLVDELVASDEEQPESIAIARRLLEELLRRHMSGDASPGELVAWLDLINAREKSVLASPGRGLDHPPSREHERVG